MHTAPKEPRIPSSPEKLLKMRPVTGSPASPMKMQDTVNKGVPQGGSRRTEKMLNIAVDPDKLLSPNGNFEVGRDDPDNAWKRNELPDVFGIFG